MGSKGWMVTGLISLILGIVMCLGAVSSGGSIRSYLDDNYTKTSANTYQCTTEPKETYEKIQRDRTPDANTSRDGLYYLRYDKRILVIAPQGSGKCTITVEDEHRYNSGAFIFLGTGFRPGSPSQSTGGLGGSLFGNK